MQSKASSPQEYMDSLPEDRKVAMSKIREILSENLPKGFTEVMSYGMLGYVVSHESYPPGYHCNKKLPLPFINLASQKNFIALYHMGIYAKPELLEWFVAEYPKHVNSKPDMGKGCLRFKKMDDIPYDFLKELVGKMTPEEWISIYESVILKK